MSGSRGRRRRTPEEIKFDESMKPIKKAWKEGVRWMKRAAAEQQRREKRELKEALRAQREALRWYNSLSDEERQEVDQALEQERIAQEQARIAKEQEDEEFREGCSALLILILGPFILAALPLSSIIIIIPCLLFVSIPLLCNFRQLRRTQLWICIAILLAILIYSFICLVKWTNDRNERRKEAHEYVAQSRESSTVHNQSATKETEVISNPLTEETSVDADEDNARVISPSTDNNEQDNIGETENDNSLTTSAETDNRNHEPLAEESVAVISWDDKDQNEEADESPEEDATLKNWAELLAESVDELASWEKKVPAITVPGDAATLADAVEKAQKGDVIQLKKSYNAYNLGVKLGSEVRGIVIDKPIAIVGETGSASDVVIKVGVRESIFVKSKSAMFKGVTFQCGPLGFEKTCEPIVSVSGAGSATFKYCSFLGDRVERSVGVQVDGANAKANFWKCNFQQFGDAGLVAKGKGTATLRYCEFLSQNHYGFSARTNSMVSLERCHFADNEIAFQAETGGGCKIVESRFELNERRAEISTTSRNKVRETDNVYDRR